MGGVLITITGKDLQYGSSPVHVDVGGRECGTYTVLIHSFIHHSPHPRACVVESCLLLLLGRRMGAQHNSIAVEREYQ